MLQSERIEYVGCQEFSLVQRRQFDPGHAMREFTGREGRDLGGEAGLAAPTRSSKREESGLTQKSPKRLDFVIPADELTQAAWDLGGDHH